MVDMTTQVVFEPLRHQFPIESLHGVLSGLQADSSVFEAKQLRVRLDMLDALDAGFGAIDSEAAPEAMGESANGRVDRSAQAVRARLEAINSQLYQSIRSEIIRGSRLNPLLRWLQATASRDEDRSPVPDPAPAPASLPATSSPFPLFGLIGLGSLAFSGLMSRFSKRG